MVSKSNIIIKGGQAVGNSSGLGITFTSIGLTSATPLDRLKGYYEVVDWGMNVLSFGGTLPPAVSCIGTPIIAVPAAAVLQNGDLNSIFYTVAKGSLLFFEAVVSNNYTFQFQSYIYHAPHTGTSTLNVTVDWWVELRRVI